MRIEATDLFAGESALLSKAANSVISLADYGLRRLSVKIHGVAVPCDQLMSVVGFRGQEAIGGMLHLTNYRLIFKSHPLNRLKGKFSIFLPTIQQTRDASHFIAKKLEVQTMTQTFVFVVWGIPQLIAAIESASQALTPDQLQHLQQEVSADPDKLGDGLQVFKTMERVVGESPEIAQNLIELVTDPMSLSNILNVLELWRKLSGTDEKA